ncbi:MAG: hypothetical protein KDA28_17175, partial [Phycisphaerales bacterium]|nr:hypothetical protein [Phycisphaerales bacterium]
MDRLSRYTELVPLPVLVAAPIVALVVFFLIPARWRLPVSLIVLVPWLTVGRLTDFPGGIQVFTKATGFAAYLGVGIAAMLDPGPNRRLPIPIWTYPLFACMGFA